MPKKYLRRVPYRGHDGNSIGGACIIPAGQDLPRCRLCEKAMVMFFQFDLLPELELPFQPGSHLSVFMCPEHNEIPSFEQHTKLPRSYWETSEGHWYAALAKSSGEIRLDTPKYLEPARLELTEAPDNKNWFLAVGGDPQWIQEPEHFTCSCGTRMHFVCQLSDGYHFPKLDNAPEQPDSSSKNDYVLFLGNEVYVFACPNQCDPRAVWITVQN